LKPQNRTTNLINGQVLSVLGVSWGGDLIEDSLEASEIGGRKAKTEVKLGGGIGRASGDPSMWNIIPRLVQDKVGLGRLGRSKRCESEDEGEGVDHVCASVSDE
jgi:hypothetical protein